ncbi:uncharacterized protein LOC132747890 [Ruditapes philippinarum]|uniref:uncharacterized protein LOC132747890 n=1 Tax=Ruditapes philippinarum TaxID=129788 RepID=UPI00295B97C3|nr:uncharacterized protein LOC132747890 [Ruditapes philippinarum]
MGETLPSHEEELIMCPLGARNISKLPHRVQIKGLATLNALLHILRDREDLIVQPHRTCYTSDIPLEVVTTKLEELQTSFVCRKNHSLKPPFPAGPVRTCTVLNTMLEVQI